MRRWFTHAVVTLALAVAACGPSAGQVKTAREARYQTEPNVAFTAVMDAVTARYKVDRAAAATGELLTVARWYEPEGNLEDRDASGSAAQLQDGSVLLRFHVRVVVEAGAGAVQVVVTPQAAVMRTGYAQPVALAPDDLALPGWVHGKTDDLYLAIYAKLKTYEIKPGP